MEVSKMKQLLTLALMVTGVWGLNAQAPSLDDFLGPLDNDAAKGIVAPTAPADKVAVSMEVMTSDGTKTPAVTASSMQDAVVAGASTLKQGRETCLVLKVSSGTGYMAEGSATYKNFPKNRNATLLSKRDAYVRSYMIAKANLARFLYGLDNKSQQSLDQSLATYDTANDSLANSAYVSQETIDQKVEGLIRGTVIYSINDDPKTNEVTVLIITTPKTRGETMQLNPGFIMADSARNAMAGALKEIKAGVIPPSGGKVIAVESPQGEQFYFIAFGSEIIRTNTDADVATQLKRNAFSVAEMRATANLVGLIIGDQVSWTAGYSSKSVEENKQFDEVTKIDPTTKEQKVVKVPLDGTVKAFTQESQTTNAYASAQSGRLPPGVNTVRWESADGDWAFAAMIYNPAITLDAKKVGELMATGPGILDKGNSLTDQAAKKSKPGVDEGMGAGNTDKDKKVDQGPSGTISDNSDL